MLPGKQLYIPMFTFLNRNSHTFITHQSFHDNIYQLFSPSSNPFYICPLSLQPLNNIYRNSHSQEQHVFKPPVFVHYSVYLQALRETGFPLNSSFMKNNSYCYFSCFIPKYLRYRRCSLFILTRDVSKLLSCYCHLITFLF